MKTKTKIFITLFALSVVLNIGLVYEGVRISNQSSTKIDNVYNQNLSLFSQNCYDLEQDLAKLTACNQSEQAIRILTDVVDDTGSAVASLSTLPLYPEYVAKLNRYLNHFSDYSKFIISECSAGKELSDDCRNNMQAFSTSVASINKVLNELSAKLRSSPMNWSSVMNDKLSEVDIFNNDFSDSMESIQNDSIDYPTLIYDGPFSDSVVNKKITENGNENIERDSAVSILIDFIGTDGNYSVKDATICNGTIDTWCITLEKNGKYFYGNVAVNTGKVVSFITDGTGLQISLSRDEAIASAEEFLTRNGYKSMVPQYCQIADGNATINFVRSVNGVLIYPDMVKVRVDMENGTVNGFEGMSYYANCNNERDLLFDGSFTLDDALLLLPESCSVLSSSKAIIPTDGGNELLAYEFRCKIGENTFVIYFDAKTKKQVKIFKIIYSENGEFVV